MNLLNEQAPGPSSRSEVPELEDVHDDIDENNLASGDNGIRISYIDNVPKHRTNKGKKVKKKYQYKKS